MPHFCCVVNCGNRSNRDNVRFYRIPKVLSFKHKVDLNELSAFRRERWISAIRRDDLTKEKLENARVCSKHFISGKPAELIDKLNPDWVPTMNMGYKVGPESSSSSKVERYKRGIKRKQAEEVEPVAGEQEEPPLVEETEEIPGKYVQTDLTSDQLTQMFLSLTVTKTLETKLLTISCTYESFHGDNVKTKYYTGLDSFPVLEIFMKYIEPFISIHKNTVISAKDQIVLCLIKLRLNLDFKDLAYRFGISPTTCSTYFKNTLHVMCLRLKNFVFWPDRAVLRKTVPSCFKESFHEKTTVIIDCFEIRCETPAKLVTAAQSWSSYKHNQTVKYLIGITPQGSVCFISEGWGGRVSDKFLTEHSTFLNNLIPGDIIMADRGFLIKEFVEVFQATVKLPAFTRGKSQLHPIDLEATRAIAHVRIHVERVIGLIRQKYNICNDIVTLEMLRTGGDDPLLDEIVFVSCALINICPPIVPL